MDLTSVIWGLPIGLWLAVFAFWTFGMINRMRRIQRRRRSDPFRDLNPTRSAITCPRCHAPWPGGYEPVTHREHMWKGVACPHCGVEYDERGHERHEAKAGL